jgi:hypothetical protein
MNYVISTALLLVTLLGTAGAQTPLERAKAALPQQAALALQQTVADAMSRGLPTEPLVDKALEGVAKSVAADVILAVVRQRLELLVRADAALRPFGPAKAAEVTAAADVMQRGISDEVITRVRSGAITGEPVDLALNTLADLLERGVPVEVAFEMLSSWRQRGAHAEELRQMPAAVERLVGEGATPGAAGRAIAATVRAGKAVGAAVGPKAKKNPTISKPGKGGIGPPVPPGSGPPLGRGPKK